MNGYTLPISVVIAASNEAEHIQKCVLCAHANRPAEIVVVDGASTDATADLAEKMGAKVIRTQRSLPAQRQIGVDSATQPYIAIVDADDELEPDCLAILLREMTRYNYDAIQARVYSAQADTYWAKGMGSTVLGTSFTAKPTTAVVVGRPVIHTTKSLRQCTFDVFFDGYYYSHDDTDISMQLAAKGFKLGIGTGVSYRHHKAEFWDTVKKLYRYGRTDGRFLFKYPYKAKSTLYHLAVRYPVIYAVRALLRGEIIYLPYYWMTSLLRLAGLAHEMLIIAFKSNYK